MSFRVGQKVVCVDDNWPGFKGSFSWGEKCPKIGEIYTIETICQHRGRACFTFYEIRNKAYQYNPTFGQPVFGCENFRPIEYAFGEKVAEEITEQVEKTLKEKETLNPV